MLGSWNPAREYPTFQLFEDTLSNKISNSFPHVTWLPTPLHPPPSTCPLIIIHYVSSFLIPIIFVYFNHLIVCHSYLLNLLLTISFMKTLKSIYILAMDLFPAIVVIKRKIYIYPIFYS